MEENTKNTKNTKKIVLGVVLFAVVIAVLFGCWKVFGAKTTQGAKSYTLTVQDDQGDKKVYEGYTDAEYVRGALEELEKTEDFTLEGSESDYGLYIEKSKRIRSRLQQGRCLLGIVYEWRVCTERY